jgi:DNA polymerase
MSKVAWIDGETYSEEPLTIGGTARYWEHPSTFAHCLGVAFDDGPVNMATRMDQHPVLEELHDHIVAGGEVWAHKAEFEFYLLQRHGFPIKRSQMRCTMAMAAAGGYPMSLDKLAFAVGLQAGKHPKGRAAMLKLCVPNPNTGKPWTYEEAPQDFENLYEYCAQDVELERAEAKRMMALSPDEQKIWLLDQEINMRGIGIDRRAAAGLLKLAAQEFERLDREMNEVTRGLVPTARNHPLPLAKFLGMESVAADTLKQAYDACPSEWSDAQIKAAELRMEAAKASAMKIKPMIQMVSDDGRLRWTKQYHGAGPGRWAGRGVQPDNLPKGTLHLAPEIQDEFLTYIANGGPTNRGWQSFKEGACGLDMIKETIRGLIIPAPDHEFIEVDYAAIETRLGAWVVGDNKVLDVFWGDGKVYEHEAADVIYHVPLESITKKDPRRQVAKRCVLSLQYQVGAERLHDSIHEDGRQMGAAMEMSMEEAERIKTIWREAHPAFPKMWRDLETVAKDAVKNPGTSFCVKLEGGQLVTYCYRGYEGDNDCYLPTLLCRLPSGRILSYPFPKLEMKEIEKGPMAGLVKETLMYRVVENKQWRWTHTYGGKLFENIIQALGACILRHGLLMVNAAGIPVVMHTHDSILTETVIGSVAPEWIAALAEIPPAWGPDLPLKCSYVLMGGRYRKE